jgi:radical SAM protein with 4Fe4S-binding SPASM domain
MRAESLGWHPRVAIWEVTRACDLACSHCRASAVPARDPNELTTDEALALLGQVRDLGPDALVLTGGDPLKRPDLLELVRAATRLGLHVALAPSVTPGLTPAAIASLAAAGVGRVALSLDGPDAATHDAFRGMSGSFAATLRAMAAVREAGIALQVNTSLSRGTVDRLLATSLRVSEIAPTLWSVFFVVPVGRASQADQLDSATCERVFHALYDWGDVTGLPVKTTAAPAFRRVFLERERDGSRTGRARRPLPGVANDGKGFVFVGHTGDVYPSGFLPLGAGNVRRDRLADVYRHAPLFRALRDETRLEGKCGACPFRSVCGGSRARAWAVTGNAFASDPACAYVPRGWSEG